MITPTFLMDMKPVDEVHISEIAYALGFEHPQSFTKLFKRKTNLSPLAYRQSLN